MIIEWYLGLYLLHWDGPLVIPMQTKDACMKAAESEFYDPVEMPSGREYFINAVCVNNRTGEITTPTKSSRRELEKSRRQRGYK